MYPLLIRSPLEEAIEDLQYLLAPSDLICYGHLIPNLMNPDFSTRGDQLQSRMYTGRSYGQAMRAAVEMSMALLAMMTLVSDLVRRITYINES